MASKLPEIASSADRLLLQGRKPIRRIGRPRLFAEIFDPKIDLAHIKPVASRSKLRSRMDSSLSCSARSRSSQLEVSVNLLSAIAKARCCAASRCSSGDLGPAELLRGQNPAVARD